MSWSSSLDTADVDEIREIASWGILDGVTTNPSLIKKSGRDFKTVVAEIASICDGPISAEVTALDTAGMVEQGRALKEELPPNVIIKIPCTPEGLAATKILTDDGIKTNVTLVFSAAQALMAAKAGATYVSPFIGRIDDTGADGMALIAEIMATWDNYNVRYQGSRSINTPPNSRFGLYAIGRTHCNNANQNLPPIDEPSSNRQRACWIHERLG